MFMLQTILIKKIICGDHCEAFFFPFLKIVFPIFREPLLFLICKIFILFTSILTLFFLFLLRRDFDSFHEHFFVVFLYFLVIFIAWFFRHLYIDKNNFIRQIIIRINNNLKIYQWYLSQAKQCFERISYGSIIGNGNIIFKRLIFDQFFAQYNYERSMSCLKKHKSQQTHTQKISRC